MATYGKILLIAMPVFLWMVLLEKWYGWRKGKDTVRNMDMVSSLTSGITNVTKDVLGLSVMVYSYGWMVQHWALLHVTAGIWDYFIAFFVLDFAGYWIHRMAHRINFFWNNHIIHHSSEEYNLACALRQSISVFVRIFAILLLPAALLGVPEQVIAVVAPLHLFIQFWYHTQHIHKMGWLEQVIVTPSHHRVHHAINPEYIDKNFSEVFILWDKLFGTFQPELETVKPVYGVTRPVRTWNPVKINFMHMWLMAKDAWRTESWKDKYRIWWMPTGWRPTDVEKKYPEYKLEDVYDLQKYDTDAPAGFLTWCWVQMSVLLIVLSFLFANIEAIGLPGIYAYGLFVFVFVYALAELMDNHMYAWGWELLKAITGLLLIFQHEDWLHLGQYRTLVTFSFVCYLMVSCSGTIYFNHRFNSRRD